MDIELVAKSLKELGHPIRLRIFKTLVKAGIHGVAVGTLQDSLNIPGSTLSHHIASLVSADLVKQRREGRVLYCVAQYEALQGVIAFLQDECCVDDANHPQGETLADFKGTG